MVSSVVKLRSRLFSVSVMPKHNFTTSSCSYSCDYNYTITSTTTEKTTPEKTKPQTI